MVWSGAVFGLVWCGIWYGMLRCHTVRYLVWSDTVRYLVCHGAIRCGIWYGPVRCGIWYGPVQCGIWHGMLYILGTKTKWLVDFRTCLGIISNGRLGKIGSALQGQEGQRPQIYAYLCAADEGRALPSFSKLIVDIRISDDVFALGNRREDRPSGSC